jgi:hypothetical protein
VRSEDHSFCSIDVFGVQEQKDAPWEVRIKYLEDPIAVFSSRSVAKLYAKYLIDRAVGITADRENRQLAILPHISISTRGTAYEHELSLCKHLKLENAISIAAEFEVTHD